MSARELVRFIEGFDGDASSHVWESPGAARSTDHARTGTYGMGKAGLGLMRWQSPLWTPTAQVIIGFAFRVRDPGSFGGGVPILELRGPSDYGHVLLSLNSQGVLVVATAQGGGYVDRGDSSPRTLDDGAWYYIEVAAWGDETAGRVLVQLNGFEALADGESPATIIDVSGIPTLHAGLLPYQLKYNQFHMGVLSGFLNEERNFSFDDIYVRDNSTDLGFLGDLAVYLLELQDDRAVQFIRLSGSKNYLMVNEQDPDEDGSYNETETSGDEDIFEVGDSPWLGEVLCVQLVARVKKTQSAPWIFQTLIELGGTKTYGPEYFLPFPDYETLPPDVYASAPGFDGWTIPQLNAIGVGYRATTPGS